MPNTPLHFRKMSPWRNTQGSLMTKDQGKSRPKSPNNVFHLGNVIYIYRHWKMCEAFKEIVLCSSRGRSKRQMYFSIDDNVSGVY